MSIALILKNANFSINPLKTIDMSDVRWEEVVIPQSVINSDIGFMWGDSGASESQKGTVVPQGYSPSWGNVFIYTDMLTIPENASTIRGTTNALDIRFAVERYNRYPYINFYDSSNNFISALDSSEFNQITTEIEPTGGNTPVRGYKGSFYSEIPENAAKYRIQWVKNGWETNTGDLSAIEIVLPDIELGFRA